MENENIFDGLRKRLEKLDWPVEYMFKFIVPVEKAGEIIDIFPEGNYSTKTSGNGNYVSITSCQTLGSENEVIDVYEKAARVEGVISL
jgi:hypothetical protein